MCLFLFSAHQIAFSEDRKRPSLASFWLMYMLFVFFGSVCGLCLVALLVKRFREVSVGP